VIDELRVEVAVDGLEVAAREQVLDECLDELLVMGSHGLIDRRAGMAA